MRQLTTMPNKRAAHMKRTTITVDKQMHAWSMDEARRLGINDFSTFVRMLIAREKGKRKGGQDGASKS